MNKNNLFLTAAVMSIVALFCSVAFAEDQVVLRTQLDRDSYETGVEFVKELMKKGGTIDLNMVIKGMQDELTGNTAPSTEIAPAGPQAVPESGEYASAPAVPVVPAAAAVQQAEHEAAHQAVKISSESRPAQSATAQHPSENPGYAEAAPRMRTPEGALLSRTNQARMDMLKMKRELRSRSISEGR